MLASAVRIGIAGGQAVLSELFQIGRQRIPFFQLIAVFVIEDAVGKIRHRGAVGIFGFQRQQSHGFGLHGSQHLGGVHPRHHPVEGGIVDALRVLHTAVRVK